VLLDGDSGRMGHPIVLSGFSGGNIIKNTNSRSTAPSLAIEINPIDSFGCCVLI
jgi:hypothetical protein